MFRIIIIVFTLGMLPFSVLAAMDVQCKKACLKDGYYAFTCTTICDVDESLGFPYKVARAQYRCMENCKDKGGNDTLTTCMAKCKRDIRTEILGAKERKIENSISEAESIIDNKQNELEKIIDNKITSREIKVEAPQVLVID